ncbi:MAG: LysR family transcriptional regulator [Oscillospiraceae bacterium]|nr:LysR family transcriptional regulator [Oscillospiraceae bacterium]
MELRVLQYFLAVARENSISGAAEFLHLSQPTLSRQLKELEQELGKQLFIRGNRRITLTEEGMILRKRAEEITELVRKAEEEISASDDLLAGDISIGAGESDGNRFIIKAMKALQHDYPLVHFHVLSGDKTVILENIDRGTIDFGIIFGDVDSSKYDSLPIPSEDTWGVLMRRDSPLAQKNVITAEDLMDKPIIVSRQAFENSEFKSFFPCGQEKLNIAATYSLLFNGSLMVDEGLGYAICFDKLINVSGNSNLCFRPLKPEIKIGMNIIWKKYRIFSKPARMFLEKLGKS